MPNIRIENWSIVIGQPNPYRAPECQTAFLLGNVYGYPGRKDGERIRTSEVVGVEGRLVKAYSGKIYELGVVDPGYAEFCSSIGKHHEDFLK